MCAIPTSQENALGHGLRHAASHLLLAAVLQTCRGASQRDRRGVRNGLGSTARPRSIDHVEPRPWVITERVPRTAFRSPRAETARRDRAQSRSAPRLHNESRVLLPKIARPRRRRGEQVDNSSNAELGVASAVSTGRTRRRTGRGGGEGGGVTPPERNVSYLQQSAVSGGAIVEG